MFVEQNIYFLSCKIRGWNLEWSGIQPKKAGAIPKKIGQVYKKCRGHCREIWQNGREAYKYFTPIYRCRRVHRKTEVKKFEDHKENSLKCNQCNFISNKKITLNKHITLNLIHRSQRIILHSYIYIYIYILVRQFIKYKLGRPLPVREVAVQSLRTS